MKTSFNAYDFLQDVSIDEVLQLVQINTVVLNPIKFETENGIKTNCNSLRLKTFLFKGTTCKHCGLKATTFRVQKSKKDRHYHLGLWAGETQLTKDHIVPKSKGGLDTLDNMQTLCECCNVLKGSN